MIDVVIDAWDASIRGCPPVARKHVFNAIINAAHITAGARTNGLKRADPGR